MNAIGQSTKIGDGTCADGVFEDCVNSAGFVDKATFAVRGVRRKRVGHEISLESNLAIGGYGRIYARCVRARHRISRNPFQIAYGVMRRYRSLCPYALTIWSGGAPVTCAEVLLVLNAFFRCGYRATVSAAEVTFDVAGIPYWRATRDLHSRARTQKEFFDPNGRGTTYIGSVRSPWQARIHVKAPGLLRIEFVLRSRFLRKHGIRRPEQLYRVKRVCLLDHVGFRVVWIPQELPPRERAIRQRFRLVLRPSVPASWVAELLKDARTDPQPWLRKSGLEVQLRKMLAHLVW
jgi:hypothetical protein